MIFNPELSDFLDNKKTWIIDVNQTRIKLLLGKV